VGGSAAKNIDAHLDAVAAALTVCILFIILLLTLLFLIYARARAKRPIYARLSKQLDFSSGFRE
jgi:uncharacterized membrane protein YozB (DUF420 family)